MLTLASNEAASAKANYGFTVDMGAPFKVSATPIDGLALVQRLYNPHTHDFFWTAFPAEEHAAVANNGYVVQGPEFWAAVSPSSCDVPVYRLKRGGMHRYLTSDSQRVALVAAGWTYEGIGFYGSPPVATGGTAPPSSSPSTVPVSPTATATAPTSPQSSASTSGSSSSSTPSPVPTTPAPAGNPLSRPLYGLTVGTNPWTAYMAATDLTVKRELYQIASTPAALWLGGASTDEARVNSMETAAVAAGETPTFVLYAIPDRDCGGYSAGGLSGPAAYDSWVNTVRAGIAGRPAVVIVEPDAIGWGCLSGQLLADRIAMLKYAMETMSQDPNTWVYVHAGSSGLSPTSIANNLKEIGIQDARGFALNVASTDATASEIAYGESIDAALGMQKHFVIDTSRNGVGRGVGSCNPLGRSLGVRPTTNTGNSLVDAFLWIKTPGGSDGPCNGGPPAGSWFQGYALALVTQAESLGIIVNRPLPGP